MNEQRLKEIEDRTNAATPGPWDMDGSGVYGAGETEVVTFTDYLPIGDDADFIAYARQDIPDLIAEVRRLREELNQSQSDNNMLRIRLAAALDEPSPFITYT